VGQVGIKGNAVAGREIRIVLGLSVKIEPQDRAICFGLLTKVILVGVLEFCERTLNSPLQELSADMATVLDMSNKTAACNRVLQVKRVCIFFIYRPPVVPNSSVCKTDRALQGHNTHERCASRPQYMSLNCGPGLCCCTD
jgi:hypothetical protein